MVLEEIKYEKKSQSDPISPDGTPASSGPFSIESHLASPMDRMAAFIADLVLFAPVMTLTVAPFRRMAFESELLGAKEDLAIAWLIVAFISLLVFCLFQAISIALFAGTPGKFLLGLRVVNIWSQGRPTFSASTIRAFSWVSELLCFGIPLLAIYSNERRRTLHDRFADTVVVTVRKSKAVSPPGMAEASMASGFYVAIITSISILAMTSLLKGMQTAQVENSALEISMEERGTLCTSVGEARSEWIESGGAKPSRLAVALALYGSDAIDEECLKVEAEYSVWKNEEKPLAYLAKAFASAEDDRLYESYLDKACESGPSTDACRLVTFVRYRSDESTDDLDEKAAAVEVETQLDRMIEHLSEKSPAYLKVWTIRHLMDSRQYERALSVIDQGSPQRRMGFFFAKERGRALWSLDRKAQARLAMRASLESLEPAHKIEMTRWFCVAETAELGCSEQSRLPCGILSAAVETSSDLLEQPDVEVAYIRGEICKIPSQPDNLQRIVDSLVSKDAKDYVSALIQLPSGERSTAIKSLKRLASARKSSSPIFFEANRALIDVASSVEDLKSVKTRWWGLDPNEEGWKYLGQRLLFKFSNLKAWDQTLEIGMRMVELDRVSEEIYQALVIASYHTGKKELALNFIESLPSYQTQEPNRQPASMDEFEVVVERLMSRTKGKP